ncbi:TetR/AcrR family transcriptional regulator [Tomitella gaofuii]|uniref:TetR/AcrR family transcriptional regulator n=1 Tax=Tomitella gaofuii TaxID=2760083 RepID=UPI0015FCE266|nr:TetR/AcrR family transcriptional regulator [Tomitella gaofuii]
MTASPPPHQAPPDTAPTGAPVPGRPSRGEITRARIVTAAAELFEQSGYTGVSLRDLSREVGVSVPGITRHFRTKEEILMQVLASLDRRPPFAPGDAPWATAHPLSLRLRGEAASADHPAHSWARRDLDREITGLSRLLGPQAGPDPAAAARTVVACRDGLALLRGYGVVTAGADELIRRQLLADTEPAAPLPGLPRTAPEPAEIPLPRDYGDARRTEIARRALDLFAAQGYRGTSMSGIAEAVGTSKASLFHHFGDKLGLLTAVLAQRDRSDADLVAGPACPAADRLRQLAGMVTAPGVVQLYTVLASEAATPGHPAHEYFRVRFHRALDYFGGLFDAADADGTLRSGKVPRDQAVLAVALWEGTQVQWLLQPDSCAFDTVIDAYVRRTFHSPGHSPYSSTSGPQQRRRPPDQ